MLCLFYVLGVEKRSLFRELHRRKILLRSVSAGGLPFEDDKWPKPSALQRKMVDRMFEAERKWLQGF
jgi:hypothetical protein